MDFGLKKGSLDQGKPEPSQRGAQGLAESFQWENTRLRHHVEKLAEEHGSH